MVPSLLSRRRLLASDDAIIMFRNRPMRPSSLNIRSVRHSPMPCAPYSRAFAASAGVSALALTPSRLACCAHRRTVRNSGVTFGSTRGRAPGYTAPVLPSIVMVSPSLIVTPPDVVHLRPL